MHRTVSIEATMTSKILKSNYHASSGTPVSPAWYFNQGLLNFNQYFASDAGYMF